MTEEIAIASQTLYCIGHCCQDETNEGYVLGGSASYAAFLAKKLRIAVEVITSCSSEFAFLPLFADLDIPVHTIYSDENTTFRNSYIGERRVQHLLARASDISVKEIEPLVKNDGFIFLCPIADEIDFKVIEKYKHLFLAATIQGWLRKWDEDGLISAKTIDFSLLKGIDLLVISEEDIDIDLYLKDLLKYVSHIVVTSASKGANIYKDGCQYFYPSYKTNVVDSTGAGDIFATAYAVNFYRFNNVERACVYAHCAASISIEGFGVENIPDHNMILQRVEAYNTIGE